MTTRDPLHSYEPAWIALSFSIDAMLNATARVNTVPASDPGGAFAAIGEAVWWITLVGDTLRRQNRAAYDSTLDLQTPRVDDTIDGLRSVRNRIGHEVDLVTFIEPVASRRDPGDGRITAWRWRSVRPPTRRRTLDVQCYDAYERDVAGVNVVHVFERAKGFLTLAYANNPQGGYPTT